VLVLGAGVAGACAKGSLPIVGDAGSDATTADGGACPQFDLQTDPKHCGSCTNACQSSEVCSAGQCKSQCESPTTKCTVDGGALCITLATDPNHCGQCTTVCATGDAGGLAPGTDNPAPNVPFDGGYDGGPGWSLGAPDCDASTCGIACPNGMSLCNGVCFDEQNHHDHCGACTTACQSTEWCGSGHCCAQGTEYCGGSCVDPLTDDANCGSCGHACNGGTPYCSNGTCVAGCTPSGSRQAFNTLQSHTTSGCWDTGNPCAQDTYNFSQTYGQNFQAAGQDIVCSGTTACVGHVGIGTYGATTVCQGTWDVYCDTTKVGTIDTLNTTCTGSAMTNGCNISFTPTSCSTIKLVGQTGTGDNACCGGSSPDSMIVAVSAW